ncbi:MAG: hypothetical protein U9N43_08205 [Euryarchaeota archaeon]|nr:hypothetical protein [Euryarchaeota archaeon]
MPDINPDRWKIVSTVVVAVALISIMLNVYFYLPDDSKMPPCADDGANDFNVSNVSNMSDENETKMHKIAVVAVTAGSTTKID